jgi:hypothetical protein
MFKSQQTRGSRWNYGRSHIQDDPRQDVNGSRESFWDQFESKDPINVIPKVSPYEDTGILRIKVADGILA